MYNHNLSRAFSNLNLLGVRTYAEERSVSYDNELFDLYLRMPVRYRLSANVHRRALGTLDARLNGLPNANTNLPGNWGPCRSTLMTFGHKVLRRSGLGRFVPSSPSRADRSWHDRDEVFRVRPRFGALARGLADSDHLASLAFMDMHRVAGYVDAHMNRRGNYGALLFTLLTIDEFLREPGEDDRSRMHDDDVATSKPASEPRLGIGAGSSPPPPLVRRERVAHPGSRPEATPHSPNRLQACAGTRKPAPCIPEEVHRQHQT